MRLKPHLCTLLLCLSATLAHAQQPEAPQPQNGSITGTVTDVNDDVVPNTIVILDGQNPADHRTTVADATGFFEIDNLAPGVYHLTVGAKGFADYTSPAILLKPGLKLDLPDISLQLATAMTSVNATSYTQHEMAVQQVKVEETERILGVIPNFYVVFSGTPVPLSVGQKFSLAWRSAIDPVNLALVGVFAGVQQGLDSIPEWGQDWPGYGQRYGALLASGTTDLAFTGFIFPALLHQDPRYMYKGTGSIRSRIGYAIATTTVVCKGDNGHWQPNYSNVLGNFATAGITNFYYPAANRGIGLTVDSALINTASGAISGLFEEFLLRRFTSHSK